jgi:hypothetical protein
MTGINGLCFQTIEIMKGLPEIKGQIGLSSTIAFRNFIGYI